MNKVWVYNNRVEVDNTNPSFNYWLNQDLPFIEIKAVISDGTKKWKEKFKVTNIMIAEKQVKQVIEFFNATRPHPDDLERKYISLYLESEELMKFKDDEGMSGWLNPEGEFFACGFGEHVVYASEMMERMEVDELAENNHVPMSHDSSSSYSHIGILGKLTEKQIEWFDLWFDKLSSEQKSGVKKAYEEQGIEMEYAW